MEHIKPGFENYTEPTINVVAVEPRVGKHVDQTFYDVALYQLGGAAIAAGVPTTMEAARRTIDKYRGQNPHMVSEIHLGPLEEIARQKGVGLQVLDDGRVEIQDGVSNYVRSLTPLERETLLI